MVFGVGCVLFWVAAAINWWSRAAKNERVEEFSKPAATIGAIIVALGVGGPGGLTAIAVGALVLCLAGDIALLPRFDRFLTGLAIFLAAHLVFVAMFIVAGVDHPALAAVGIGVVAVIAAIAGGPEIQGATARGMGGPVVAYFAVIAAMVITAFPTGNWLFIAGAISFVLSDTMLGWGRFVRDRPWMSPVIMVTYHLALFGLAAGLRLA